MGRVLLLVLLSCLFVAPFVTTAVFDGSLVSEDTNITIEEQARNCLDDSQGRIDELAAHNFSVTRLIDILADASSSYEQHTFLQSNQGFYDFSVVLPYCDEISRLSFLAFAAQDELFALERFYDEFLDETMNTTSIDALLDEINREMQNERYERVSSLVDEGYTEIVRIQSEHTTLNLVYQTTTRSITGFFRDHWSSLLWVSFAFLLVVLVYKKAILRWWITHKIHALEARKTTLKELIMTTQKDYFERGELSEGMYRIKTQKFAELTRDIDRQIPLLREDLIRAGGTYKIKDTQTRLVGKVRDHTKKSRKGRKV